MKTITQSMSTPKADGYRMPGEHEPQERIWMLWPHRTDTWSWGAKPAQRTFAAVARAIARFEPVTVCAKPVDYEACRVSLGEEDNITVVEMESDDAWMRDCGPSFVVNDEGGLRAVHWHFNAWGGLYDGLCWPWDQDALVGLKVADLAGADNYRPDDFILEGGSISVDGEGTVLTTEMCLLSPGRNPQYTKDEIENLLLEYLGAEKVIWLKDGLDPEETNGHVDGVAGFTAPGEVACIWTDDVNHPYYQVAQDTYKQLCAETDAKGRPLKVHKIPVGLEPIYLDEDALASIDVVENMPSRETVEGLYCEYINFLIVNGGVIVPQYGDPADELALAKYREVFPDREVVGVFTKEILYGGGNIHCITQQQPLAH